MMFFGREDKLNVHNFAVFDTETIGISPKLIYDLALIVCNRAGEPIAKKSWIIREVMTDAKQMLGAFYSNRVFSHYIPAIDAGRLHLHTFADARAEFNAMIAEHNAKTVCAYNIAFDRNAVKETAKHTGHVGKFLAKEMHFADLWLASCRILANTNKYRKFCAEHNFISDAGNVRTSAETIFAYLKQNPQFVESHTALEDCEIESEILGAINKRKRGFPRNELDLMPWKIPQKK
jgi:hypothetical protein